MKIERISENQIRCTLTSFDLSVRDLDLGELAYGSEKAKKLFREMIQKASNEVGFEADSTPLMVEAIPLSGESIMLIITKIEDPEELDTRFSKFSPSSEEDFSGSTLTSNLLEGADGLLELFARGSDQAAKSDTPGQKENPDSEEAAPAIRYFTFESLEQVCLAAQVAGVIYSGTNSLYKNPVTSRYYLALHEEPELSDPFRRVCNLLTEYGKPLKTGTAAEAYYQEHYVTIVAEHALQTLSTL